MDDAAAAAFARAAALLARDEHLDDDSASSGATTTLARNWKQPPRAGSHGRVAQSAVALPRPSKPLPTLAELSQQPILSLTRPKPAGAPAPRAGRRAAPSTAESRKAAMSVMEAAMPSLDEESARLIARAHALLDTGGTDPAMVGKEAGLWRPAGKQRGGCRASTRSAPPALAPTVSPALVPTASQIVAGATVRDRGLAEGDDGAMAVLPLDAAAVDGESGGGDAAAMASEGSVRADVESALAAVAGLSEAMRSLRGSGPSSPRTGGSVPGGADGSEGGGGGLGAMLVFASGGGGGAGCMASGGGHGGAPSLQTQAQQRVRAAKLAAERAKAAERQAQAQREAASAASAARAQEFQADVRRRNASRRREEKEMHARQTAEVEAETAAKEARLREQAAQAEEVRRSTSRAVAARRAQARREEAATLAQRATQAAEARERSQLEGAQLQAAALARVRERRRQTSEAQAHAEVAGELEMLADAPKRSEGLARAREQRRAAAERLRSRRVCDEAGDGAWWGQEEGDLRLSTPSAEGGHDSYGASGGAMGGACDGAWDGGLPWCNALNGEAIAHVGFVIRGGDEAPAPAPAPRRLAAAAPPPVAQPRRPNVATTAAAESGGGGALEGRNGGRVGSTAAGPQGHQHARGGRGLSVANDGAHGRGAVRTGGCALLAESSLGWVGRVPSVQNAARRASGWRAVQPRAGAPVPANIHSCEAEPAQVLEIRSPTRAAAQAPSAARLPPTSVAPDPPPVEPPELELELEPALPQAAMEAAPLSAPNGKRERRRPWQRPPVPLDRPL